MLLTIAIGYYVVAIVTVLLASSALSHPDDHAATGAASQEDLPERAFGLLLVGAIWPVTWPMIAMSRFIHVSTPRERSSVPYDNVVYLPEHFQASR